ncbi:MAG: calcium-translocating P-type ATPase, PMCA-type [Bacteroidaceae bacterium]|nr:calcium-translocating P-type ATPase, PMCA-type [Bacteroidaceae bacterium]
MNTSENDFLKTGLTSEQVEASRRQHGRNLLTPPKRPSIWRLYAEKYKDPIIRILLIAALFSLGIGIYENEYVETIGILVAVFLATTIGFYFEYDAQKKFDILNALGQEELVTVIRDSQAMQVPRSELVVGDVVILEQGVEIPADGLLLEAINLQVNESSLTGEPICHKTTDEAHFDREATYPSNRVLRSSMVVDGHGCMKVDAVGDETEIGHVARHATTFTDIETPLNQQLNRLSKLINKVAFTISLLVFVAGTSHGLYVYFQELMPGQPIDWAIIAATLLKWFMVTVTLIVMAVPEGLPMAVTLSLALNMRRMLRTNNLVRKLHACETMGAVTVICTDKTGTLTQNRMEVADIQSDHHFEEQLAENMAVNSTALLEEGSEGQGIGNPTECALLLYLRKNGKNYSEYREKAPLTSQLTFSTERKYMATLVTSSVNQRRMLYVKGAPEVILELCQISTDQQQQIEAILKEYQAGAMRTLAFAHREIGENEGTDCLALAQQGRLTLEGICAIMDPVRPEVPSAVKNCHDAGIHVKMVTGDNAGTAIEIAKRIGLWTESDREEQVITGAAFAALSDEEALNRIASIKVMSRARPMDKQRFVKLLQEKGAVVAVTGDGTNDVPALNRAQVGLSMGSGTSIAKEASDITLIDDSFRSIATAVMWGRSLYKNIQRFLAFQLTISLTALAISMVGSFLDTDIPLTVTQILWINLIVDTFASLALSTIPPSADVMKEQPRKSSDFILSRFVKKSVGITAGIFFAVLLGILFYFNRWGNNTISLHDLTVFFTFFVMLQFWNLMNARVLGSHQSAFSQLLNCKGLLFVMSMILIGQILIVEFGGKVFRTEPLDITTWLTIVAGSSLVLWIGEIVRFIQRKTTC